VPEIENSHIASTAKARPDLNRHTLLLVLGWTVTGVAAALLFGILSPADLRPPGVPLRQIAAIFAAALLLTPLAFFVTKRSGFAQSPPGWFVAHVIASAIGIVLAFLHASGGKLASPPGIVLLLGFFLVLQGIASRAWLSERFSTRFAAQVESFRQSDPSRLEHLRGLIERKRTLLSTLDPDGDEALFSPNLRHWLRRPLGALRYVRLAHEEARLVGSRGKAGLALGLWRRIHMVCAGLFVGGLILHILVVTFFAGYVAGEHPVYWWHLSAWGGPR